MSQSGESEKEVKWMDEITHAFANFTRENEASENGIYKHPQLRTIYATYPHPDEHLPAARRYVLEKSSVRHDVERLRLLCCRSLGMRNMRGSARPRGTMMLISMRGGRRRGDVV